MGFPPLKNPIYSGHVHKGGGDLGDMSPIHRVFLLTPLHLPRDKVVIFSLQITLFYTVHICHFRLQCNFFILNLTNSLSLLDKNKFCILKNTNKVPCIATKTWMIFFYLLVLERLRICLFDSQVIVQISVCVK